MAFNPFHRFRKHQKAWFAGLTIMVMIVFILGPTGSMMSGGDFFSDVSRWVSGSVRKTDLASIDGKEVSADQMRRLRLQRQMANYFMANATARAQMARAREVEAQYGPNLPDQEVRKRVSEDPVIQALDMRLRGGGGGLYFNGSARYPPIELLDFLIWQKEADRLGIYLSDADIDREIKRLTHTTRANNYFNPTVSRTIEGELRSSRELSRIYTPEALVASLRDEFRVRLAQEAMGYIAGANDASPVPAAVTPYEFKKFYDDNCTKVEVALLPVKVEDFVKEVQGKPTDQELKELYTKHRDEEYSPDKATPGFKQPKRVQVEWVSAKADAEVFKKVAVEKQQTLDGMLAAGVPLGAALTGSSGFVVGATLVPPLALNLEAIHQYKRRAELELRYPMAAWTQGWGFRPYPIHESSMKRPAAVIVVKKENKERGLFDPPWAEELRILDGPAAPFVVIAGAVGDTFGLLNTAAAPFGALNSYQHGVYEKEKLDRVLFESTWFGVYAMRMPFAAAAIAAYGTPKEEYLPYNLVKDSIIEIQEKDSLRHARNDVLERIKKELALLNSNKGNPLLSALSQDWYIDWYIADQVKRYDLQTGTSAELAGFKSWLVPDPLKPVYSNKFNLADDAGLKPLKAVSPFRQDMDPAGRVFHRVMSSPQRTYQAESWPFTAESADEAFLFWHKDEKKEATVPMDNTPLGRQVRAEVDYAWRFNKARELAKKKAESILEDARKEKADSAEARKKGLRDLGKQKLGVELIELRPAIGKFNRGKSTDVKVAYSYDFPRIDSTKVLYPGPAPVDRRTGRPTGATPFAEKVVALRTKSKGDGAVIPDGPDATYYVTVVVDLFPPDDKDFYEAYKNAASLATERDPLLTVYEAERVEKYQKEFMERLRKDAKLETEPDKLKELDERGGPGDE